jgi:hypothetical protein
VKTVCADAVEQAENVNLEQLQYASYRNRLAIPRFLESLEDAAGSEASSTRTTAALVAESG